MKNFGECKSKDEFFDQFMYRGEALKERYWYSSVKAKAEEAATIRNPIAFSSSSSPSSQSPRPPLAQQKNQRGVVLKRKKQNIRILLNGDERVVSPYFPLPPNAIVLDPRPQTSKRREKDKGHIHSHSSDNVHNKKKKATSDEMLVEKNLNYNNFKRKNKKSITLSAAEKRLDIYKRVSHDNTWVAPSSHHQLLQEEHCYDPWRVLIICTLLNRTKGSQVKARGVLSELFKICPNAEAATTAQEENIQDLLRPLGLHNKKAAAIKRLSSEYLGSEWTHVTQLYGVGKYAADAYAIFCVGNLEEVTPLDHKLVDYWKFVCKKRAQGQQYRCTGDFSKLENLLAVISMLHH